MQRCAGKQALWFQLEIQCTEYLNYELLANAATISLPNTFSDHWNSSAVVRSLLSPTTTIPIIGELLIRPRMIRPKMIPRKPGMIWSSACLFLGPRRLAAREAVAVPYYALEGLDGLVSDVFVLEERRELTT